MTRPRLGVRSASRGVQSLAAMAAVVLLAGCVTTATGDRIVEPDKDEAARLNRDLAINYLQQGKYDAALEKLQKSLDARPENPDTHRVMGFVYERLSDLPRAETAYRKAVRYGPEDQAALNQLAVFLCRYGDDRRAALRYFDRALALPDYQDRYVIFTNAGTCAKDFDLEAAEEYLRKALKQRPTFTDALYQMSDVAYRRENFLQARAFIERCMAVSEPVPDMLWLAYRIESALDAPAAAEEYGAQLLERFPASAQARQLLEGRREPG